ncbi:restriction endonuclease subunit S [Comamonas testosteroni]|uniref:restriction endonuclease subunit S n=1 Tax=Comamonas testosteroni TaxID=285 RepID=UPI0002E9E1F0|nr:restriction endonuclease subunit S [Comamonas testosteroni]QQN70233.1 restriction endonuclease subunit S [Comamonas testosteroni]
MSRYKAYPEYEKSKLQWAERTPKHWNSVHLRWIAKLYAGGTPSKAIEEYWENGVVPWINSGEVNQGLISEVSTYITEAAYKNSSAKWIPKNALVMALAGQGKTKGMIAQLAIDATCNQSMAAIVPQNLQSSRYLFWWLYSNYQNIRNMAGGDLRDGLNLELLGDIGCPIPNVEEQLSIAAFLDHETAKIDALIEKQQRLIELLKEKRQAVISHAVTKGLNPNAPMKDSGVEWLGEVPAHWEMKKLRFLGEARNGLTYSPEDIVDEGEGTLVLRSSNVQNMKIAFGDNVYVNKYIHERIITRLNDILICSRNGSRALIGKNALIEENAAGLAYGAFMMVFRSEVNPYIFWVLNSQLFEYQSGSFLTSMINQLTVENINGFEIPLPPAEERSAIIAYVKERTSKIDVLISQVESSLALIHERRTALISAAVTGKIDVRDWQAAA